MKLSIPKDPIKKALALSRYSERVEMTLVVIAIVFVVAYTWQVMAQPTGMDLVALEAIMFLTWAVFFVDYVITMALTDRKKWFTPMNLLNFVSIVLPVFRAFRIFRVVSLLRTLNRSTSMVFRKKIMAYVISSATLLTYLGALAALDAERMAEGAKILNFGDSLWWAFITITTVGYGDYYPVTLEGRLISVGLTISGISLMGLVTVTMGTWVMGMVTDIEKEELAEEIEDDLDLALVHAAKRREEAATEFNAAVEREAELEEALAARKRLTGSDMSDDPEGANEASR